ncbi:modification methylase-like protein [Leishmania guyanensis]|uniref:DNA (cytosine-5-)-methyltransferase n=1 Tax=Leishmania guyanensis TaxID=5670 RepID=A0A1E1IY04_LEIGU|nr:Putative modification methylase-like protein [Leishmania guyanensis]
MASPTSYPSSYPAGIFVVRSKQQLAPLVTRLRATRRLKPGRNVTEFDGEHFAELAEAPGSRLPVSAPAMHGGGTVNREEAQAGSANAEAACGLRGTVMYLRETTEAEAAELEMSTQAGKRRGLSGSDGITIPLPTSFSTSKLHSTSMRAAGSGATSERCVIITTCDSVQGEEFLSLLRVPYGERAGARWPPYMAAHVVGTFAEAELRELLSPGGSNGGSSTGTDGCGGNEWMESSVPVAYIRGIRRFHRVCCPVLAEMPSALAAMRRTALLQRHHRLAQCDEAAGNNTCPPPSLQGATPLLAAAHLQPSSSPPVGLSRDPDAACAPLFTFSELFCGIGMFRSGLERVGGRAAFAVDFAPPAQIVYALNHRCLHDCPAALQLPNATLNGPREDTGGSLTPSSSSSSGTRLTAAASAVACQHAETEGSSLDATACSVPPLVGNITEIPNGFFPTHDVLTGGFPCQSFAKAGDAAGLHAEKGWLFYEVVRVVAATQPTAFLLENVDHLIEVEAGAQLAEILARLRHPTSSLAAPTVEDVAVEYEVQYVVVDGGALTPQTRKRVYFFGFKVASALVPVREASLGYSLSPFTLPRADDGEARATAARVITDALQRIKVTSLDSPYRSVQELLVHSSTVNASRLAPQSRSMRDEPTGTSGGAKSPASSSAHSDLQLTHAQWEAVRRSRTYRQNPLWRLCDLQGRARTLLGSYRTSYQLYSEFVPSSPELTQDEVAAMLLEGMSLRPGGDAADARAGGPEGSAIPAPAPPPLRFFALRECARLQGIEDGFLLPHDTTQIPSSADAGAIPAAVLRQVPSGAVYKLIGNAVNPRVVACLGGAIASYLQERRC